MPTLRQAVDVGPRDGSRFQRVIALVDPDNTFAVMPSPFLSMLGVSPEWTAVFELPGGAHEERPLAEIRLRINQVERTVVCVFGAPDSQPVLGKHSLDAFGLSFDEASGTLVPGRIYLH